jgi:spore germination cell wall hydrolase CwlJ-like protein
VDDGRFGRDVCAVVKAPKQFSFVRGGSMPTPNSAAQWETAKAIALIAVSGSWPEVVPDATHFHATRVSPGWKLKRVATVGSHVFYR